MKYLALIREYVRRAIAWASRIGWWTVGPLAAAVIIALLWGISSLVGGAAMEEASVAVRSVTVKSVAELASETAPLSIVGTVESRSSATVRAEKSGQLTSLNRSLGDSVSAGTLIAQIENASEQAALLQAQGSVAAAQANLDKVHKGTRSEQIAVLRAAVDGAESSAVSVLLSAYAAVDNAVKGTADKMLGDSDGLTPTLQFYTNAQLSIDVQNARVAAGAVLKRQAARSLDLTATQDLLRELTQTESELRSIRAFLDLLIRATNEGTHNDRVSAAEIATYLANVTAARTAINAALSSVVGARQVLDTAQKNINSSSAAAQPEDVALAEATLTQARASLASARANLEKSIIRSPIAGTINSLSLKRGDYVQASTPVVTIANNGSLEVIAYITESDSREISVGQAAALDGGVGGVVTKIAPALDPITKKIEVRIGITDEKSTLINGQSVLVQITRTAPSASAGARLSIPISAIKVEADRISVFTVNADGTLLAHEVVLGALLGDRVVVASGVTGDMRIVTDARGLRAGQTVEIQ